MADGGAAPGFASRDFAAGGTSLATRLGICYKFGVGVANRIGAEHRLKACPGCARHVRECEGRCPFCERELAFGRDPKPTVVVNARLGRAALFVFGATFGSDAFIACSSSMSLYGGAPMNWDGSFQEAGTGGFSFDANASDGALADADAADSGEDAAGDAPGPEDGSSDAFGPDDGSSDAPDSDGAPD